MSSDNSRDEFNPYVFPSQMHGDLYVHVILEVGYVDVRTVCGSATMGSNKEMLAPMAMC